MISDAFKKRYKSLNAEQKKAVDNIEGPVMVVAGPGTGKTTILTLRIANILLKTDTSPECILALTFTDSGVISMRKKLAEIIGAAAYRVNIFTFHGFCNELIKDFPEEFPKIISSANASDIDQIKIMEEVILSSKLQILKPFGDPFYYLNSALNQIKEMKREDISPEDFAKLIKKQEKNFGDIPDLRHTSGRQTGAVKGKYERLKKNIEKNKELLLVYEKYQSELSKRKLYDYEDMIMEAVRTLSSKKEFLLEVQEKYQYILADEHQDANNSQNKLLELLSNFHDSPNLFIVGDEKQAIYRFQGASLENFLYFKKLYPEAVVVNLKENYRSTQEILDGAHSLISKNNPDSSLKIALKSQSKDKSAKIKICEVKNSDAECAYVADEIKKRISGGADPSEIAVLYRNNKDAGLIAKFLGKAGVPFSVFSDSDLFSDDEAKKIILFLRAIDNLAKEELLAKVMFIDFLDLPNDDVYKILAWKDGKGREYEIPDILKSSSPLLSAKVSSPEKFSEFWKKILRWNKLSKNTGVTEFFETTVRESGFLEHLLLLADSVDKLDVLNNLFEEVKKVEAGYSGAMLSDFIEYLDLLEKHKIRVNKKNGQSGDSRTVRLMTAHRSKGLEFETVYILGAALGHWGNARNVKHFVLPHEEEFLEKHDQIDDERRLFYVAITRAKKEAVIMVPRENSDKKELAPSQFIEEIGSEFIERVKLEATDDVSVEAKMKFGENKNAGVSIGDKEFLKNLFLERGMSPTALNTYLDCPWKYFFQNLVRIPAAPEKWLTLGIAIHSALKNFFDRYRDGKSLSKIELVSFFKNSLQKQPIRESEFEESLKKGEKALCGYYDFYKGTWSKNVLNEFGVSGIFLPVSVGGKKFEILLKGKIDKIEIAGDGSANVVDYKTTKPKSRNEIEGLTKSSNGAMKRQLVFYKLLLDRACAEKFSVQSGEIDFLEPDERGKYKKEKFSITETEVKALEDLIAKVSSEILEFSFWNGGCGEPECEFCALKKFLKR